MVLDLQFSLPKLQGCDLLDKKNHTKKMIYFSFFQRMFLVICIKIRAKFFIFLLKKNIIIQSSILAIENH